MTPYNNSIHMLVDLCLFRYLRNGRRTENVDENVTNSTTVREKDLILPFGVRDIIKNFVCMQIEQRNM